MLSKKDIKMSHLRIKVQLFVLLFVIKSPRSSLQEYLVSSPYISTPGEIQLAGFFNVHEYGTANHACGKIKGQNGIKYVEAMLFAVDQINKNKSFLFGNKIGTKLFDYCHDKKHLKIQVLSKIKHDINGVIGPSYSDDAMWVADVLWLWDIPVISFAATSQDIENRKRYPLLYRTVASDGKQVELMIQLANNFNWTYIAFLHSYGSYGERAFSTFQNAIKNRNICVPIHHGFSEEPTDDEYISAWQAIIANPKVKVAFLFLIDTDIRRTLKVITTMQENLKDITIIASEEWGTRYSTVQKIIDFVNGSLTIQTHSEEIMEFKDYFLSLKPENNTRNIWFNEFWREIYNCSIHRNGHKAPFPSGKSNCSENEFPKYDVGYYLYTPVQTVINAVYAYAYAFKSILEERCSAVSISAGQCVWNNTKIKQTDINKKLELSHFEEPFGKRTINFDNWGSFEEDYDIFNFQQNVATGKFDYKIVGQWRNPRLHFAWNSTTKTLNNSKGNLTLNIDKIRWKSTDNKTPISRCSTPCVMSEVTAYSDALTKCCWNCKSCPSNAINVNNTCVSCHMDFVPDSTRRYCIKLDKLYLTTGNIAVTLLIVFMSIGSTMTFLTLGLLLKNFSRRIVKASSRESSINILIGILLLYLTPVAFIIKPNIYLCHLQNFIVGLSLTICYSPLFLKLMRLYRIFKNSKITVKRPVMISSSSQILMSIGLSSIELFLGLSVIKLLPAEVKRVYPSHRNYVVVHCPLNTYTVLFNLAYPSALMVLATWFAFQTRKLPKNYNETKYIGITLYITCIIVAIGLPTFLVINDVVGNCKILLLSFMCEAIATVNLCGLFGKTAAYLIRFYLRPDIDTGSTKTDENTAGGIEQVSAGIGERVGGIGQTPDIKISEL